MAAMLGKSWKGLRNPQKKRACLPTAVGNASERKFYMMWEKTPHKVCEADFLSDLADESTESCNKEQIPIKLRYVNSTLRIREDFVTSVERDTRTTVRALAKKIAETFEACILDIAKLRGKGYIGAGAMAGRVSGCAALIMEDHLQRQSTCIAHLIRRTFVL